MHPHSSNVHNREYIYLYLYGREWTKSSESQRQHTVIVSCALMLTHVALCINLDVDYYSWLDVAFVSDEVVPILGDGV